MSNYTVIAPSPTVFDVKDPQETIYVNFDFGPDLAAGETISAPTITVTTAYGTDASPSAIKSGGASVVTNTAIQKIIAGLDGVDYRLECQATTSAGRVLVLVAILPVREV